MGFLLQGQVINIRLQLECGYLTFPRILTAFSLFASPHQIIFPNHFYWVWKTDLIQGYKYSRVQDGDIEETLEEGPVPPYSIIIVYFLNHNTNSPTSCYSCFPNCNVTSFPTSPAPDTSDWSPEILETLSFHAIIFLYRWECIRRGDLFLYFQDWTLNTSFKETLL